MRRGIHVENLAMTCTMGQYTMKRRRGCGWDKNRFEQKSYAYEQICFVGGRGTVRPLEAQGLR